MKRIPETEDGFKGWVIDLAQARKWLVHHDLPSQRRNGRWSTLVEGNPGFPDLVLARRGQVIFAELKKETGKGLLA